MRFRDFIFSPIRCIRSKAAGVDDGRAIVCSRKNLHTDATNYTSWRRVFTRTIVQINNQRVDISHPQASRRCYCDKFFSPHSRLLKVLLLWCLSPMMLLHLLCQHTNTNTLTHTQKQDGRDQLFVMSRHRRNNIHIVSYRAYIFSLCVCLCARVFVYIVESVQHDSCVFRQETTTHPHTHTQNSRSCVPFFSVCLHLDENRPRERRDTEWLRTTPKRVCAFPHSRQTFTSRCICIHNIIERASKRQTSIGATSTSPNVTTFTYIALRTRTRTNNVRRDAPQTHTRMPKHANK